MPEEGRARLQPLCPWVSRMRPCALVGCWELPAGHHHAVPSSHASSHSPAPLAWRVQPVPLLPGPAHAGLCACGCANTVMMGSPRVPSV